MSPARPIACRSRASPRRRRHWRRDLSPIPPDPAAAPSPPPPHGFWQEVLPAGSPCPEAHAHAYPARFPDGRMLNLPIRVLPGDGKRAVASLIINQASFAVEDALAEAMADLARPHVPDIVVAVPTLGLTLANAMARRLGHDRLVPLGTSRKFWYREDLSEPLSSITTPGVGKRLYVDPRMLPVLEGRRVVVVDDVVSGGTSMATVLSLLAKVGIDPVAVIVAMTQTDRWRAVLPGPERVHGVLHSPFLSLGEDGLWRPE